MKMTKRNVLTIIFGVIAILGVLALIYPLSTVIQGDTLWHIKNGEWIIQNHKIPEKDYFSYHNDLNFISHEWLFDIIIYFISKGGTLALNLFALITTGIGFAYIIFYTRNPKQIILNSILLSLITISGFYKGIMAIPDTIGAIIIIASGNNLLNTNRSLTKKIIINTILSVILVNYQGGMMSAAIVQSAFIVLTPIVVKLFKKEKIDKYDKSTLLLIVSSFIGSLINPYFIFVYKYGFMINTEASKFVSDWQPFAFTNVIQVFLISIAIILAIYGSYLKHNKTLILDRKLCLLFFYLVILCCYKRAVNLFISAIILYVGNEILSALEYIFKNTKKMYKKIVIGFLIIIILFNSGIQIYGNCIKHKIPQQSVENYLYENYLPKKTIKYIKNKKVFNVFDYGGHLIYLNIPVFVDGRIDCYTPEYNNPDIFMESYKALYSDELMLKLSYKYGFTILILDANSVSTQIFIASSNWRTIDYTNNIIILERVI